MSKDRIILNITPQTNIRATQGAAILFRIPEECPVNCGLPRKSQKQPKIEIARMALTNKDLWKILGGENWKPRKKTLQRGWVRYGCPHSLTYENLMHKRRLEKYNRYKEDLLRISKENNFEIPNHGFSVYFYLPVPQSKSNKKKLILHGQHHDQRPDIDNYFKAMLDSLLPEDKIITQLSGLGKFWVNQESGYIEILLNQKIYNPFNVVFLK